MPLNDIILNHMYFETSLNNNNNITGGLTQNLSGKIIVEIAPPTSTGATSMVGLKDYLQPTTIYQIYLIEGIIASLIILSVGFYKIISK